MVKGSGPVLKGLWDIKTYMNWRGCGIPPGAPSQSLGASYHKEQEICCRGGDLNGF